MNDVFTTLAVVALVFVWLWLAFFWAMLHMDSHELPGPWWGQAVIALVIVGSMYALIQWAVTT